MSRCGGCNGVHASADTKPSHPQCGIWERMVGRRTAAGVLSRFVQGVAASCMRDGPGMAVVPWVFCQCCGSTKLAESTEKAAPRDLARPGVCIGDGGGWSSVASCGTRIKVVLR